MAKLHSLIKYRRHVLDEKRRDLADLNHQLESLEAHKQKRLDSLAHEKALAATDSDAARHFPNFLHKIMGEIADLDEWIAAKKQEIHAATLVVQEAFLEVKKLEITQERRDSDEAARLDRLENIDLDEMGINAFLRQQGENSADS